MSFSGEVSGVILSYVTREITEGEIPHSTVKFNKSKGENERTETTLKSPVVVFFPNKTCAVFSAKEAEEKGFMKQPDIINFEQVTDNKTAAGRFKFSMKMDQKIAAWTEMEDALIQLCVSKSGHPLPLDCRYSEKSMFAGELG